MDTSMDRAEACDSDYSCLSKSDLMNHIKKLKLENAHFKKLLASQNCPETELKHKTKKMKAFDFSKFAKRHILLKLCYLGWDYDGFVVQENTANTIEAQLFDALLKTKLIESRETSNYHRCGRTDKGVSAFDQVISITVRSKTLPEKESSVACNSPESTRNELDYVRILNSVLPDDIRILAWCPVSLGYSARFDCTSRTYKYFFPRGSLDIKAMETGGLHLIGEHDFRNLCKMDVGNGVINYKRKVISFNVECIMFDGVNKSSTNCKEPAQNYKEFDMCVATIQAEAFLWHQIRAIMTVLFLIGEGKESPSIVKELLDINNCPRKPQYVLASDLPLVLYSTSFSGILWKWAEQTLANVVLELQKMWTCHSVKSTMIRLMIKDLSTVQDEINDADRLNRFSCSLIKENLKSYKPLLSRQTCESLETKINYFVKKQKLPVDIREKLK